MWLFSFTRQMTIRRANAQCGTFGHSVARQFGGATTMAPIAEITSSGLGDQVHDQQWERQEQGHNNYQD
jgi:hypothetical protein